MGLSILHNDCPRFQSRIVLPKGAKSYCKRTIEIVFYPNRILHSPFAKMHSAAMIRCHIILLLFLFKNNSCG